MKFIDFIKNLFDGFKIGYHSKSAFRPEDQERTDAMEDIRKGIDKRKEVVTPPKAAGLP